MKSHLSLRPPSAGLRGGIGFGAAFVILVGILILWGAKLVVPIYFDRWILKQAVVAVANEAKNNNRSAQELYTSLNRKLDAQNVRLAPRDFELDVSSKRQVLKVYFQKEVRINDLLTLSADEWIVEYIEKRPHAE